MTLFNWSGPYIDTNGMEEQEKEKRRLVIEKFQKAPFEEIAAQCESKVSESVLNDSLELRVVTGWQDPSFRLSTTSGFCRQRC